MKKIDINKYKADFMQKFAFDFKQWMSPTIRDYYALFLKTKRNKRAHLLAWIKEYSVLEDGQPVQVAQKPIQVSSEARELYLSLQSQIGEEVHVGDWFTVTQDRVDQFANVTEDHQWLHNDVERAKTQSPFKTTIAHGFLTLSLIPRLTNSVDASRPAYPSSKMTVNYGLNQVRFPYPVKTGSVIRAHSRLIKVSPIKRGLEIEKEISVEIQGMRRPGCVAVSVVRVYF